MKSVVFSLLLSLAAPWGAVCLADAPGHTMACCPANQSTPMVRPCCAIDADRSAPTIPAAAQSIPPMQLLGTVVPPAGTCRFHRDALGVSAARPIEIRLLTSVILI